jgi:osmotically-inducible protein OsmY
MPNRFNDRQNGESRAEYEPGVYGYQNPERYPSMEHEYGSRSFRKYGSFAGRGPKGYKRSDERIEEDVCERLTENAELDASEIGVQVHNCEVTLSGTVEDRYFKKLAENIAESVSGVKDVHNQIRVSPSYEELE